VSAALAFVPLFEAASAAVNRPTSELVFQSHLLIQLLSSISRSRSAFYQTA
jgi:hypothetical protein